MTRTLRAAVLFAATLAAPAAVAAPGGYLGVWLDEDRPQRNGARLERVGPRSPAAAVGLRTGERVVAFDGVPTPTAAAFAELLGRAYPGQTVRLGVLSRGKRRREVEVTLGAWGELPRRKGRREAPGEAVLLAGEELPIGAPVITYRHPQGYDGYLERCFFSDDLLPSSPAAGCDEPRRYSLRRHLPPALAEVVAAKGFTPELAAVQIDQVVIHYDVAWTSRNCFKVLHDRRGLSCHFLLDVDGVLYQTLDLVERARHAGSANDRSIGIEIAHPGPLELTSGLADRYRRDGDGVVFDLGRLADDPHTPDFLVRPARPEPVRGVVQGRPYSQYDFTDAQYETLSRLLGALHRALPRIRLEVPRGVDGAIRNAVLDPAELDAFSGIVGHYHVSSHKQDPGPAFDWERLLKGARAAAAAPPGAPRTGD